MIAGLQPETFESFIGQRSRWARGMAQILLLKNPLFIPGLKFAQRLCYLSSSLFWLFPLSRMVFIFAPLMYIFFDMKIYIANGQEFIAYTLTYMLSALLVQSYVFGRVRWPWTSDLYEYVQSVKLFPAVVGVFLDPRRPKFNVTAEGADPGRPSAVDLAWPYFALFCLVAVSIAALAFKFVNEPDARDLISVVGVWSLLNLCLTGVALGVVSERRERRSVPRVASKLVASLAFGAQTFPVAIEDMSFGGLKARALDAGKLPPKGAGVLRIETGDAAGWVLETPIVNAGRRVNDQGRGVGLKFYGFNGDRFRIIARVMFCDHRADLREARQEIHSVWRSSRFLQFLAFGAEPDVPRLLLRGLPKAARGRGAAGRSLLGKLRLLRRSRPPLRKSCACVCSGAFFCDLRRSARWRRRWLARPFWLEPPLRLSLSPTTPARADGRRR